MQDEKNHTPTQRMSQMTQPQIVAGVKRIVAEKFSYSELLDMKSYVNGLITVANSKEKDDE
jgi:hypothetical protein